MDTPEQRHKRYTTQAQWTQQVRSHLLKGFPESVCCLDVGCGTGVITSELPGRVYGIDILREDLLFARQVSSGPAYCNADAYRLPYASRQFDLVSCHFLLLWLTHPEMALSEMIRVMRPGSTLVLFAEPDYGGRIDYPSPLEKPGKLQAEALRRQGADPEIGRKLRALLVDAGLLSVESGVTGGEWLETGSLPADFESEWDTLLYDLHPGFTANQVEAWRKLDRSAWMDGSRILYVPTFYARGIKA
jgi:SAM-dependent methyltransferase